MRFSRIAYRPPVQTDSLPLRTMVIGTPCQGGGFPDKLGCACTCEPEAVSDLLERGAVTTEARRLGSAYIGVKEAESRANTRTLQCLVDGPFRHDVVVLNASVGTEVISSDPIPKHPRHLSSARGPPLRLRRDFHGTRSALSRPSRPGASAECLSSRPVAGAPVRRRRWLRRPRPGATGRRADGGSPR